MKFHLPNSAFLGNIDPFLRSLENGDNQRLEVTFNKNWVSVHPVVICMVTAYGLNITDKNQIKIERIEAKSRNYFERIGLFKILGIKSGIQITEHEPAGRFVPLSKITNSEELHKFITDTIPILHLDAEQVPPLRYVLSELASNVFEHSQSQNGAVVCAQRYAKSNTIRIGVVDTGVGIKKSITRSHRANTDLDAIKLALTPGITGTTKRLRGTEQNAGAGLFFIKSIAKTNRDFFMIYSGNSMYKLLREPSHKEIKLNSNPFKDKHSSDNNLPYWQGTAVGIDISLTRNQKFDTLLDLIHTFYRKDIKAKNGKRFKKVKFVD